MQKIPQYIIDTLNNLSCEQVAEKLGIKVQKHKALCFMHDDHHPSLAFYGKNREFWICYACNKGGSAITLVMEYTNLGFVEACQLLGELFNIHVESSSSVSWKGKTFIRKKRLLTDDAKPFLKDVAQWILDNNDLTEKGMQFLFCKRKLCPEVIEKLHIVSVEDSQRLVDNLRKAFDLCTLKESGLIAISNNKMYFRMFTPCLLFPYFDRNDELVGLQSRYLGGNKEAPRFQFVSAQKTRIYNLPILNSMKYGDDLYISEGITDCLALLSSGKKAVSIPSATILPKNDLIDLSIYKLHMYPDQDDAGRRAFMNLRRYFINHYTILKEERLPEGVKDYSEYYIVNNATEK